jgi:hypothetical protein
MMIKVKGEGFRREVRWEAGREGGRKGGRKGGTGGLRTPEESRRGREGRE